MDILMHSSFNFLFLAVFFLFFPDTTIPLPLRRFLLGESSGRRLGSDVRFFFILISSTNPRPQRLHFPTFSVITLTPLFCLCISRPPPLTAFCVLSVGSALCMGPVFACVLLARQECWRLI
ncbi:hypothetical protein B0J11DRAFT_102476 [Dendryphion nanum]|uniref:Uncharacterized protein n=1 Tax=Dendryphion nanum TaxID=256645 RepID=A0A9P9DDA4_9PLEO|nr:hypothetical protein B0J11DRAFT_102476 [Dendryphion nanum]